MPTPLSLRDRAFSLVEIVIAIGILSFAILAIMGLFSIGLDGSRESGEDTHLALMLQQVHAWSRTQPFATLSAAPNRISANPPPKFFYDSSGELTRNVNGDPAATADGNSFYACTVAWDASPTSQNLINLVYRFEWPLSVAAAKRRQIVVNASRAKE